MLGSADNLLICDLLSEHDRAHKTWLATNGCCNMAWKRYIMIGAEDTGDMCDATITIVMRRTNGRLLGGI